MSFHSSEFPPANFPHLPLQRRVQKGQGDWRGLPLNDDESPAGRDWRAFCPWFKPTRAKKNIKFELTIYFTCMSTARNVHAYIHFTQHTDTYSPTPPHNHSPLTPAYGAIPLLLSQAPIIESQVGINSRSCTWLGQKQLLQGGNVFFYTALHID